MTVTASLVLMVIIFNRLDVSYKLLFYDNIIDTGITRTTRIYNGQ